MIKCCNTYKYFQLCIALLTQCLQCHLEGMYHSASMILSRMVGGLHAPGTIENKDNVLMQDFRAWYGMKFDLKHSLCMCSVCIYFDNLTGHINFI